MHQEKIVAILATFRSRNADLYASTIQLVQTHLKNLYMKNNKAFQCMLTDLEIRFCGS